LGRGRGGRGGVTGCVKLGYDEQLRGRDISTLLDGRNEGERLKRWTEK